MLQKSFSTKHGRYYYYSSGTSGDSRENESTWDEPIQSKGVSAATDAALALRNRNQKEERCDEKQIRMQKIREFVASRNAHWSRQKDKNSTLLLARRSEEVDKYWNDVCSLGATTGCVQVLHKLQGTCEHILVGDDLNELPDHIVRFEKIYNRALVQLNLVGIGLINKSFQNNRIPSSLVELSLSSNNLTSLSCGIFTEQMKALKKLNLSHNRLTFLPEQLEEQMPAIEWLHVGNNDLVCLPNMSSLKSLRSFTASSNQIQSLNNVELPVSIEKINMSCNILVGMPKNIHELKNLQSLNLNKNCLKYLPGDIGQLASLKELLVCRNDLRELPASLCSITSLVSLKCDFNKKLAALPAGIHLLKNLQELKCEGNIDMVLPTLALISKGVKGVLRWSALRFEGNVMKRRRDIIMRVQEVLGKQSDGSKLHKYNFTLDDRVVIHFEFDTKLFFDIALEDGDFPYERNQLIDALQHYSDAKGKLASRVYNSAIGSCWRLRSELFLEQQITEARRKKNENNLIRKSMLAAESAALTLLKSEMGDNSLTVISISLKSALQHHILRKSSFEINLNTILTATEFSESSDVFAFLETVIKEDVTSLNEVFLGWNFEDQIPESCYKAISSSTARDYALGILADAMTRIWLSRRKRDGSETSEHLRILKCLESYLSQCFVNHKVSICRENAIETNTKMRKVLRGWMGIGLEQAFKEWKKLTIKNAQQRERDKQEKINLREHEIEEKQFQHKLKLKELREWKKKWDKFSGRHYWVNAKTQEERWDNPHLSEETMAPSMG